MALIEQYSGYMYAMLVILIFAVVAQIFRYILEKYVKKLTGKSKNKLDDIIIISISKPLFFFLILVGIYFGGVSLGLTGKLESFFSNTLSILFIIDLFYFLILMIDSAIEYYFKPLSKKTKNDLDDQLVPIIRKVSKFTLVMFAFIIIIDKFGYDISSLVAGLGIGGLAFALAAKDLLGNVFGGVTIFTDKPFKTGQMIKLGKYTGTVKEIGLRRTKLLTLDGTNVIIPNSKINGDFIENVSMETTRKVRLNLTVTYSTTNIKIEKAKQFIKEIIKVNEHTADESTVHLSAFNESSLNLLVIYRIKNTKKLLEAKDQVNMAIKKSFEKEKIDFAFPTQTLHVKK